jgi:uncharacterized protein
MHGLDPLAMFGTHKPAIAMLHLAALPGSPRAAGDFETLRQHTLNEAALLADGGVDGMILENFGDVPFYPSRVPPHTIAFMTRLAAEVHERVHLPLGVNVLRNDALAALAVASASGASFIRVNVLTGARVADQGIIQGEAHRLLRYRQALASHVRVFADVAVKHSAPLGGRPVEDDVEDTIHRGLADAIVVSGPATGKPTPDDHLRKVRRAAGNVPVFVASGVNEHNVSQALQLADGVIVGTSIKEGGITTNPIDPARLAGLMRAIVRCR